MLTAPTVIFPTDFDSYPAKSTPNINVTRGGTTGNIVFDYTFVPRNVGQYEIPAVPFTYFDPEKGSYTTITIPAQSLNIQKGERSDEDVEQERHLISGDIPDIHTPTRTVKGTPTLFWGSLAYWGILVAICIGAIITIILLRHHIQKSGSTAKSRKSKSIRKALRSIKLAELQYDKDHNAPAFYGNIGLVIVRFISERWDIPESELSNERMKEILAANGIIPTTSAALLSLYERCQFARYAPGAAIEGIENMGRELRQLLNDIDHVSKAPKMKSAKASLLFFLLLALPAEASVTNRADSLYAAGKYAEACQLYEQARSQGLSGTDLYYNLGCTYYRQSDYVNAILNFERALRIDPADKDALYAIKFCRTHVTMPTEHTSTMFFITWADRFVRSYSADTWGTWSLCLLIAFFVTLAGYLLLHRKAWRKLSFTLMILAFLSFGLTQIAAGMQAHHYHEDRIAVIKSPTPLIAEDGKTVGQTLMPGVTIRILSKTENLLQIEIPVIGISGWVAEKDIERL